MCSAFLGYIYAVLDSALSPGANRPANASWMRVNYKKGAFIRSQKQIAGVLRIEGRAALPFL